MTKLIITILILNVFAPYVGSWLPPLAGSPAGGVLRDLSAMVFGTCTFFIVLRSNRLPKLQVVYLFTAIWLGALFAVLVITGGQISAGILGARNLILFPIVGILVLVNIQMGTINKNNVTRSLYILGWIAAILGILDVVTHGKVLTLLGYKENYADGDLFNLVVEYLGFRRASGGLADSLNYGYAMSLFAIYAMYGLITSRSSNKLSNLLSGLLVLSSSIAVVLSLTRGAILVLLIGLSMFIMFFGSTKFKVIFIILISVGTFSLAISEYGELLYGRFTDSEKNSAQSSQTRIDMASKSIDVTLENPFGIGLGTQGAGSKFINDDMRVNTDNYFFWVLVESGILSLFLLLSMTIINYIICFKYARNNKKLFVLCTYMIISYAITGMLSSAQISPLYSILYWVIINIEAAPHGKLENNISTITLATKLSNHAA